MHHSWYFIIEKIFQPLLIGKIGYISYGLFLMVIEGKAVDLTETFSSRWKER